MCLWKSPRVIRVVHSIGDQYTWQADQTETLQIVQMRERRSFFGVWEQHKMNFKKPFINRYWFLVAKQNWSTLSSNVGKCAVNVSNLEMTKTIHLNHAPQMIYPNVIRAKTCV